MPILKVEQFGEIGEVEPTSLIAEPSGCAYVERASAYPCSAPVGGQKLMYLERR